VECSIISETYIYYVIVNVYIFSVSHTCVKHSNLPIIKCYEKF